MADDKDSNIFEDDLTGGFRHHLEFERSLSKNTVSAYFKDVEKFLSYLHKKSINPLKTEIKDLDGYLWHIKNENNLSARSVFRKMQSLKSFYRFLMLEDLIKEDPARHFKTPHMEKKLPDYLTVEEMKRLLNYPVFSFHDVRTSAVIELFYACGIRISELINLKIENVNTDDRWVLVFGKGAKERMVPVYKRAFEKIEKYIFLREKKFKYKETSPFLFVNKFGTKLSRVQVWKDIKNLAVSAGIKKKIHPHLFRHTFATHLLQGGADLRSLQEMLGHSDLSTTQIYAHIDKSEIKNIHTKFHPRG